MRKVYTFTIGRLSWQTDELAARFHATCGVSKADGCLGLQYALTNGQVLVVGADKLPVNRLVPLATGGRSQSGYLSLVRIIGPPLTVNSRTSLDTLSRPNDVLLPHNIGYTKWSPPDNSTISGCMIGVEDRIHNVLNNHLHIEHPLQASYTAAMFFLFQDATVKDVITLSDGSISLKFDKNVQKMALKLVIPLQSLWFSLFGCGLLCLSVLVVVVHTTWMRQRNDPLDRISEAQVVGQVMVDESKYSPFLLHRRVVRRQNYKEQSREVTAQYVIDELTLQHRYDPSENRIRFGQNYCETITTPTASTVSMGENPWILSQPRSSVRVGNNP